MRPMDIGYALVVSGPSGTGKTSLCRRAMAELSGLRFSVSYTTRPPRTGEVHGEDYFFVDEATFLAMRREGRLAEWAVVHGNYYGTSLDYITAQVAGGQCLLLDIDTQGARQIRERYDNAVFVFFLPPDTDTLAERLSGRGTDSPAVIERRLSHARGEMSQCAWYDYVIVNDDFDQALIQFKAVIVAEGVRRSRREGTIRRIVADVPDPERGEPAG